jgi:uroporphyrinogen-III synthase
VVVTAPGRLAAALRDLGADIVEAITIAIVDTPGAEAVSAEGYDWIAFTSGNAVARVDAKGAARVAAVGPATGAALRARGVAVDLIPHEAVAEALLAAFPEGPGRVLLPQAAAARATLADGLRAKGWEVDAVEVYCTVPVALNDAQLEAAAGADAITFTSSSTVTNYLAADGPLPPVVVCIGPVTAATAAERRLPVTAVANPHTVDGLVAAVVAALAS